MYKQGSALHIVLIVILLAILAGAYWQFGDKLPWSDASGYQAVFITGDQVYFGKLSRQHSQYPVLRDIYYLRINQQIQPAQTDEAGNPLAPQQPGIQLVKFGGELHGPEDEMRLNREHIIIVEDLRDDSAVVAAIREYQGARE